jgi:hypothetical protein
MKTKTTNRRPERAERLLVYFSTPQRKALAAAAKRLDTTQAALFRRAIDLVIAEASKKRGAR